MTIQERDTILAGLIEQNVISEDWLSAPCRIQRPDPVQPHSARIWQWLTLTMIVAIGLATVALIAVVALNRGEL